MSSSDKTIFFESYVFNVSENVYEPAEDSFLFAESLTVSERDVVLDMGTGCGILGIVAAGKAKKVVSVDINPRAVRCAKENARLNKVASKMHFLRGDMFAPFRTEQEFDLIVFNAPYLPIDLQFDPSWLGRAWAGGLADTRVVDLFIRDAPRYLKHSGRLLLMQSTLSRVQETLLRFENEGFATRVVAERDLPFFETLVLVEAKRLG